jgi:hypothetical protein
MKKIRNKNKNKIKGGKDKHYMKYKIVINENFHPHSIKFTDDNLEQEDIEIIERSTETVSSLITTQKIEITEITDIITLDNLNLFYIIIINDFITDINLIIMQIIFELINYAVIAFGLSSNLTQINKLSCFEYCLDILLNERYDLFYLFKITGLKAPFTRDLDVIGEDKENIFIPLLTIFYNLYLPNINYKNDMIQQCLEENHIIILYKMLFTRLLLVFYPSLFNNKGIYYKLTRINPNLSTIRYSSNYVNSLDQYNKYHIVNITIFFTNLCYYLYYSFQNDYIILDETLALSSYIRTSINETYIYRTKIIDEIMNYLIRYKPIEDLLLKSFKETIDIIKESIFSFDNKTELLKHLDNIFNFKSFSNITFLFNILSKKYEHNIYLLSRIYNQRTLNDDIELLILLYFYSLFFNEESVSTPNNNLYVYMNPSKNKIVFKEGRFRSTNKEHYLLFTLNNFVNVYKIDKDGYIQQLEGSFVKNILTTEPVLLLDIYTQEPISNNNAYMVDVITVVDFDSIMKILETNDRRFDYLLRILYENYVLPYYPELNFDDIIINRPYLILLAIYRYTNINHHIRQKIINYLYNKYINNRIELNDNDLYHLHFIIYIYFKVFRIEFTLTEPIFNNKLPQDISLLMQINILLYNYVNGFFFVTDDEYKIIINNTLITVTKKEYNDCCILLKALLLYLINHYVILYFSKLQENYNKLKKLIELYNYLNELISSLSSSSLASLSNAKYLYVYRYRVRVTDRYKIVCKYTDEEITEFTDIYNSRVEIDRENDILLKTIVYDRDEIKIGNEFLTRTPNRENITFTYRAKFDNLPLFDLCDNERIIKEKGIHINGMIYNIDTLISFVINNFINFLTYHFKDYLPFYLPKNQYNLVPIIDPQFKEMNDEDVYLIIVKKYPEYITTV